MLLLLLIAVPATADDTLAPLASALAASRALPESAVGERGGNPHHTEAKHALRDWVEAGLAAQKPRAETAPVAKALNARLAAAGLFCDTPKENRCQREPGDFDARGYVGPVSLAWADRGRYLVLQTSAGITCGYDESAYVYEWRDGGWARIFEAERNDYTKAGFEPQDIEAVLISTPPAAWNAPPPAPPLIAVIGTLPWCSSNWQEVYYRLWRADPATATPAPLVDGHDEIFMGEDPPVRARLGQDGLLLEFAGRSIDLDRLIRPVIRHFRIGAGDKIDRIGPLALSPSDMADEFLTHPWTEAMAWTEPAHRAALKAAHARIHKEVVTVDPAPPSGRCSKDPTLWQVGVSPWHEKAEPGPPAWFLLRWQPPYRFTLVDTAAKPWPGCDKDDSRPDDLGTLFPGGE